MEYAGARYPPVSHDMNQTAKAREDKGRDLGLQHLAFARPGKRVFHRDAVCITRATRTEHLYVPWSRFNFKTPLMISWNITYSRELHLQLHPLGPKMSL